MSWIPRAAAAAVAAAVFAVVVGTAGAGPDSQGSGCIAHHPSYIEDVFEVGYAAGCSGHDEPELDPVSNAPGSARDLTWTVVLGSDGLFPVAATGPTFWFGGTVTDPNSLFGQAFYELQFYPDGIVTNCNPNGAFVLKFAPNTYTACSPVWSIHQTGQKGVYHEPAAFNAMLTDGASRSPLVMHAGDTVTVHAYTTAAKDGFHLTVTDRTTGHSGTIILNSPTDGPLMPAFSAQKIGNALGWGLVNDTPNSFVWEIGHTSPFSSPKSQFCLPGQAICDSYNGPSWLGTSPLQIKGVTFGDGSQPTKWAVVNDYGGKAEINQYCGAANYGNPYCIYPWYTRGTTGFHYGVDFPGTIQNYSQADQFAQTLDCGGPFGPNSTYCDTVLSP